MFAARLKCARQISTALNAAAIYRLRRLLCGRANLWLLARGCCPRTESLFMRRVFQIVQSLHISLAFFFVRQVRSNTFNSRQTFANQNLAEIFSIDFDDDVISALAAAPAGSRPTRPDHERLLQKLFCPLFRLLAGFHGLIQRDPEVNTLLPGPFGLLKIGLGCVNVVQPRGKFFIAAADAKTVSIVKRSIDVVAISQLDPFFLFAGPALSEKRAQKK